MNSSSATPLGLSRQLAQIVGAELIDLATGMLNADHACACTACRDAKPLYAALSAPETQEAAHALLHHAVAFRRALWRVYVLACRRQWTASLDRLHAAAAVDCQRLVDECGIPLADVSRRLVLKEFGERTHLWPFCSTGSHPQGCSCPPQEVEADQRARDELQRGEWA